MLINKVMHLAPGKDQGIWMWATCSRSSAIPQCTLPAYNKVKYTYSYGKSYDKYNGLMKVTTPKSMKVNMRTSDFNIKSWI